MPSRSGEAKLHYKGNEGVLNDDVKAEDVAQMPLLEKTSLDVFPLGLHRIEAISDVMLYEVSTPHLDDRQVMREASLSRTEQWFEGAQPEPVKEILGLYPLKEHGTLIGVPGQNTHSRTEPPNNWQSDNAVDIGNDFEHGCRAVIRVGHDYNSPR